MTAQRANSESASQRKPFGCVLAGGQSTRMGRDKALLPYLGRPLIERAVVNLRACGCEPVIVGSRTDLAQYAPVIPDNHPSCGPLAGIEAALYGASTRPGSSPDDPVLFVPVDLPLMTVRLLAMLLERARHSGALATVPTLGGRPQPLCAVYRVELLPGISAAIEAGKYKVIRVMEALTNSRNRDFFGVEAVLAAAGRIEGVLPLYRWFANINTPEDAIELERLSASGRLP